MQWGAMRRRDVAVASLVVTLALAGCGKQTEQQTDTASRNDVDNLTTELTTPRNDARSLHPIYDGEVNALRRKGLKDPIPDLVSDLVSHPEIIPIQSPQGVPKYGFYDRAGIRILSGSWVLAPFEDGHNGGRLLLQYDVDDSGSIHWNVLQSEMY